VSQERDPEAEQMRLARRVARMERNAEDLRQQIARLQDTASEQMVEELKAQEKLLTAAHDQLIELQAELAEKERRRAENLEMEEAARLPLRASPDPAEQSRLEEL
jgi:hypothetical protein